MKRLILSALVLMVFYVQVNGQVTSDWRPENRTGVSAETGLLKSWPAEGPAMIWSCEDLASGYSSPSFGKDLIFITGVKRPDDILYAIDMKGKIRWEKSMGRAWRSQYPESRAMPVVEGDRVYTCSGLGDLACFNASNGDKIWSYAASEKHRGTFGMWGIAESPIIDGDQLYFSPGGPETMTIALNKTNGKLIWKSESLDDKPGYVSPILVNHKGRKMIINVSLGHVFAVDPSNGKILWKVEHEQQGGPFRMDLIKCTTPLYRNGMVYATGGYNTGGMMIKISDDGNSAKVAWKDKVLDNHHGGVLELNGYIYGSNWLHNADGNWCCIDWNTGKKMWEEHWNNKGSIIAAEGMLYIFDEKKGGVGLLKANPQKFDLVSSFTVTKGNSGPFWAHPVIHNGVLYLRHNNALVAYDIKKK